ncbi:MAG: N-6 DNA methylase [Cyanobacteria bacterium HKST-UBA02]|nr:N-6 DNA methylase [Cyanobacteria bacterium HKST-UBA02]
MALRDQGKISSCFKELRLFTARSILRNNAYILAGRSDIEADEHIRELLDEYSMRALSSWLAAKYGFHPYAIDIDPAGSSDILKTDAFLLTTGLYPYNQDLRNQEAGIRGFEEVLAKIPEILDPLLADPLGAPLDGSHPGNCLSLIGRLFEQFTTHILDIDTDITLVAVSKYERRNKGQFYTPPEVVRYCIEAGLPALSSDFMKELTSKKDTYKILDPSCGTGNFLTGFLNLIESRDADPEAIYRAARDSVYGIDIDSRAVSLARLSVLLASAPTIRALARKEPGAGKIRKFRKLTRDLNQSLRHHIVLSDSVIAAMSPGAAGDNGSWLLPRENSGDFDLVITNPPYLSFGSRDQKKLSSTMAGVYRNFYPFSSEYKIRLNAIFHELSLRFTRPGGRVVLLVPDSFLTGRRYARLRRGLIEHAKILSITEFPDSIIAGATVGRWCVPAYERKISERKINQQDSSEKIRLRSFIYNKPVSYQIDLPHLVAGNHCRFRLVFNEIDDMIARAMSRHSLLGSVLRGHTGIRARAGQKTIIAPARLSTTYVKGLRSGSAIKPYKVDWDRTWLNVDSKLLYAGGFDPQVIGRPKLMVRQTGDRIIAALDESGLYHLNNIHSFSSSRVRERSREKSRDIDLRLVLAWMNSSLWLYLYRMRTREQDRALAQIDIETLEEMPIPEACPELDQAIIDLVNGLDSDPDADSDSGSLAAIDRLIYRQYGLSPEQILHIENDLSLSSDTETSRPGLDSLEFRWQSRSQLQSQSRAGAR